MAKPEPFIRYNADGLRYCDICRCYMTLDLFHRNRASTAGDGFQRYCKVCSRDVRHQTYVANRAREIAYAQAWQAAHPEQTRIHRRRARRVYYRLRKRSPEQVAQMAERQASHVGRHV